MTVKAVYIHVFANYTALTTVFDELFGMVVMRVKNYVVLYKADGDEVVVAHIFHQSQDYARLV